MSKFSSLEHNKWHIDQDLQVLIEIHLSLFQILYVGTYDTYSFTRVEFEKCSFTRVEFLKYAQKQLRCHRPKTLIPHIHTCIKIQRLTSNWMNCICAYVWRLKTSHLTRQQCNYYVRDPLNSDISWGFCLCKLGASTKMFKIFIF